MIMNTHVELGEKGTAEEWVDFLRLLGEEGGVKTLLEGGRELGIQVKAKSWSNLVDFGVFSDDNLETGVPHGYEEMEESKDLRKSGYVTQWITLTLEQCERSVIDEFVITSYQSLPGKEKNTFSLQLLTEEGDDATGTNLRAEEELHLQVRLLIHPQYTCGHINEFLLVSFSGQKNHSKVSVTHAACTVGARVQGNFMSPEDTVICRQLSAEAKPFIPSVALTYFDTTCPTFSILNSTVLDAATKDVYLMSKGFRHAIIPFLQVSLLHTYVTFKHD